MSPLRKVQKIFSSDFLPLIPEGKSLKISVPLKSPLGDLGVKRLFGVDSIINYLRMKNYLKFAIICVFILKIHIVFSQESGEFTNRMKGLCTSNYFAIEAAFTPGFSGSAGVDGYLDMTKMFGKEKGFSWVLAGQYYFYTFDGAAEKFNYSYGHNLGMRGGQGDVFKFGTGFILSEKLSDMRFKYYFDSQNPGDGNKVVSRFYKGPISKSYGVFLFYYEEKSGKGWSIDTANSLTSYTALKGNNQYIMPTFRMQKIWNFLKEGINPDGQKGWRWFDVGLPFTPDFKQMGIRLEWFMKSGAFTSRIGFGAIYRTDLDIAENEPVASRKQQLHWYFPVWFTLGLGGNIFRRTEGDRRFQDKINFSKSLL